ncbi:hypothetical protein HYFRA_00003464 [Hymenoscyphus fraxineus]|uniref:Uncharacterized protein n=1 Tax=Hymenoscyphus fraxineus TaxID=746836 RepID=A0A9N9KSC5_9HELO|nr:hypothetical protein HYFRA_00003464 [Hymenoscyphus fraxineus]
MSLCKIHFATLLMAILGFTMMIIANPIPDANIGPSGNTLEARAKDGFECNWYSNKDAAEEGFTRSNIDTLARQGTCHVEPFHKITPAKTEECTVLIPVVNIWPATLKTSSIELIVGMALWLKDQGTIPTDILLRLSHVESLLGSVIHWGEQDNPKSVEAKDEVDVKLNAEEKCNHLP